MLQISAMVPPARERPELEKTPHKNRHTSKPPMFGDRAHGMLKMTYKVREMMYTGLRPMISERGDQSRGPTAKPQTMIEHVRIATSRETLYCSSIKPNPPVTMEDPKATHTTTAEATRVMYQR